MNTRKHIAELSAQTSDKIAAGEVVDRPVSIVKELFENSIDADSSSIVVEIKNGGKTYIRVTDDGIGIPGSEAELAFKRHATSKLSDISDFDTLETLGFRGEALASIAAVSRTELITKTEGEKAGTYLSIEGGVTAEISERGCPTGTTLIVRDLFYNTPAREKFLKSDSAEGAQIIELVSKLALAYPNVRVRMINNGSTLFSTQGRGDRLTAAATVFDPKMAKNLIKFESEEPEKGLKIEGYVSSPDNTKNSRRSQIYFVNGRYVKSRLLDSAVSEGYREKMFEGRYPVAFLFLSVDPALLDVNIHPNKREIRFDDESAVSDFTSGAIRNALALQGAVPEIRFKEKEKDSVNKSEAAKDKDDKDNEENSAGDSDSFRFPALKGEQSKIDINRVLKQMRAEEEQKDYTAEPQERGLSDEYGELFVPKPDPARQRPFDISAIRPVGTIFAAYILGSDDDTFYIIDQHAAHERVFYERLTEAFYGGKQASQLTMTPLTFETTFAAKSIQDSWMTFLNRIGFAVEEFGPKSYLVREIPAYMDHGEAKRFIEDFMESVETAGKFRDRERAEKIITKACKSAVKANNRLSDIEIKALLRDLASAKNPFTCPHGRPTVIKLSKGEIERMFKR